MAELLVFTFDSLDGAREALGAARAHEVLHYAWIDDVALVEKHGSGLVTVHSPHGSPARGALWGGLVGMLLFWWFPPAWFLGGWLGGVGGGAIIGEAMKRSGLDQQLVHEVQVALAPGTSALLLIGERFDADEMERAIAESHPWRVIRHTLSDETMAKLTNELGAHGDS